MAVEDGHTTIYCNATGKLLTLFLLSVTAKFTAHLLNNLHLLDTVNLKSNFQVKWVLNTYNKQTWFTPLPIPSPASELPVLIDLPGQSTMAWQRCRACTFQQTGRATVLSWAVDFGGWAFLQAYLLPWASSLTCVPGAQPKSKALVILLSSCVSPGFSKCPSG